MPLLRRPVLRKAHRVRRGTYQAYQQDRLSQKHQISQCLIEQKYLQGIPLKSHNRTEIIVIEAQVRHVHARDTTKPHLGQSLYRCETHVCSKW